MVVGLTSTQQAVEENVRKLCARFSDAYWSECDSEHRFPTEFHAAMAEGKWLGIAMPEDVGGAGLGITEAAIMMRAVSAGGGGFSAASTIHMNIFAPRPIVIHGTPGQRERWLKPLIAGAERACFGVTEPDAGLDTTSIRTFATRVKGGYRVKGQKMWTSAAGVAHKIVLLARTSPKDMSKPTAGMSLFYSDLDRSKIEVRAIEKMGRGAVDSNALFIDDLFIPETDLVGEEGMGFRYLVDSLNPERVLVSSEAIGLGQDALNRAAAYARTREVFGRKIGQNQGIQHPLAEAWAKLEAAWWLTLRAGGLYDAGLPCGAEANAAKLLAGRAAFEASTRSVLSHGGMGYAREYQVERLFREAILTRIAPVSEELVLSFIAEKVLGLPKSY